MLTLAVLFALLLGVQAAAPLAPVADLFTVATGFASSLALGAFKKWTGALDTKIGKAVKPIQPVIVFGLAYALPHLANAIGLSSVPNAEIVAAAPTAALIGIAAREVLVRFLGKFLPKS